MIRRQSAALAVLVPALAGFLFVAPRYSSGADQFPAPPLATQKPAGPSTTGSAPSDSSAGRWLGEREGTGSRKTAIVYDSHEVSGILGSKVRSAADEDMGRIVDVVVDASGHPRAAVIDFGGFLGVGSRKIAVDWNALRFSPDSKNDRVILDLTRTQVKAAPEYREGKPVVVLSALANHDPMRLSNTALPEK